MTKMTEDRLAACLDRASGKACRFVRAARLGAHVVDFLCPEARLVVELDCAPLKTASARAAHKARLRAIERRGFRVVRFWADHVEAAPKSVERLVTAALGDAPRRTPAHQHVEMPMAA